MCVPPCETIEVKQATLAKQTRGVSSTPLTTVFGACSSCTRRSPSGLNSLSLTNITQADLRNATMDGHDPRYVVYQQRVLLRARLRLHPSTVVPIERNYPPLARALNRHPSASTAVIQPSLSDTYRDICIWTHMLNDRERSTSQF